MKYDKYGYNIKMDLNSFYNSFHELKIENIDYSKIDEIKQSSKELNYFYESKSTDLFKSNRYIKILNKIKTNPIGNPTEKLLMLMFAVDPSFEAIKIYNEHNKINEIRFAIEKHFGVYDPNLIKIEKWYIKNILDEESKISLEEEIDKRVYKI